jgi:hypothetical protein
LQYKPNIENLQQMSSEGEESDESDSEKEDKKKGVFKAAKLNPVLYEDKDTKRQRREMLQQKKKAARSEYLNEVRREMADMPEEMHELGGQQKSRYAKEEDMMERLEQENMKRIQFTKKEMKERRAKQKDEMFNSRIHDMDDLRGLQDILSKRGHK